MVAPSIAGVMLYVPEALWLSTACLHDLLEPVTLDRICSCRLLLAYMRQS